MVYFIRARSYFKYVQDLLKDLHLYKTKPEEFRKKAREIFQTGLKALWSLSQITPPDHPPSFQEIWQKALESVDPEDQEVLLEAKKIVFSEDKEIDEVFNTLKNFSSVIQKTLKPIL
ncbi:hypothetical protein F1847_06485 [Thermodesulfobacterium sp. TA1]|uniref:hypothetical protein n=1 Tax=Thermodesulfobacterium sp. TA1 TaxID=2234087 RepID=UPI001231F2E3|nr:hypothetical protein [Thermodesulfobacterium sp. TA1]QER42408.1 hypothetical protein F1847_06485 [Thermodesulfobacterium sp. TA1]